MPLVFTCSVLGLFVGVSCLVVVRVFLIDFVCVFSRELSLLDLVFGLYSPQWGTVSTYSLCRKKNFSYAPSRWCSLMPGRTKHTNPRQDICAWGGNSSLATSLHIDADGTFPQQLISFVCFTRSSWGLFVCWLVILDLILFCSLDLPLLSRTRS